MTARDTSENTAEMRNTAETPRTAETRSTAENPVTAASFYEFAEKDPDREAVVGPGGTVLTYGRLAARVHQVSRALRSLGLGEGDRVAVVLPNGIEFLELVLAVAQVGMYAVPINGRSTPSEIGYVLRDSGARVVVASADAAHRCPEDALPAHRFVTDGPATGWLPYADLGRDEPQRAPDDRRFGYVMGYTSGTTGRPKGVTVSAVGVDPELAIPFLLNRTVTPYDPEPTGTHLVCAPLYHAAPVAHMFGFVNAGHRVVIHEKFAPEPVLRDIERFAVTSVHMVPTHFHRLLALPEDVRSRYDLSSLRAVLHAGAPCPVPVKRRMIDWLGPVVWEYLAGTEGYVARVSAREWLERPGTVGHPADGVTVRIIRDDGTQAPPGEAGTIYFGVEGQAGFTYHNDPEKTAASHRDGLGTAGDVGYLDDDGYLFLLDRRVDLIISGGANVYPAEVEGRLLEHPEVADAAVIGVPHPDWGRAVVAVVRPADGAEAGDALARRLTEHCRTGLAPYKCPRHIEFRDDFPRTETGKLQRRVLRDAYEGLVVP